MHLSEEELEKNLREAHELVKVGGLYHHYRDKEGVYRVVDVVIIEDTQECAVLYQKEKGSKLLQLIKWVRPLASWIEEVDGGAKRFQLLST